MKYASLSSRFQPQLVTIDLEVEAVTIDEAEHELAAKALVDPNGCWGYFPAISSGGTIDANLPASQRFARAVPKLQLAGKVLTFNFARLSVIQQRGDAPYHIDTDSASALTGNAATLNRRLVWRLLVNLSSKLDRELGYLDASIANMSLANDSGYVHCTDRSIERRHSRGIIVPPRTNTQVSAVLFCASRVLHTGKDGPDGHFVAGYGCEESI